ncbi:hypothetical protein [Nostocoides sp. HKS02]|uniref:hypothetical protein n=1 Tax=Nostocoides sp. HKS02 TaxID=1813880 RepID=UPI0012B454AA|nr:hypothetical protein [Tetrasphaera sp. HKS02]QGN59045.1 hypothetical protein GKE56_15430 [Tetrasphaera sp. HKS02]
MSSLWDSWAELTRFLESARLAFARERALWESLELANRDQAKLKVRVGDGWYKARLDQHVQAVADEEMLYASVLIHSYALAESAAIDELGLDRAPKGVEHWGAQLLRRAGADWTAVKDGESGAVELAVVRNAFAHGTRRVDATASKRLSVAGAPRRAAGAQVSLTYDELRTYRARLASLLNEGGLRRPQTPAT